MERHGRDLASAVQNLEAQAHQAYAEGRLEDAFTHFQEAATLMREAGLTPHPQLLTSLATCHLARGELDAARAHFEAILARDGEPGLEESVAMASSGLGYVAQHAEDFAEAKARYADAADRFRDLGAAEAQARAVLDHAGACFLGGELGEAVTAYRRAVTLTEQPQTRLMATANAGGILLDLGRVSEAITALDEALDGLEQVPVEPGFALSVRRNRAFAALLQGEDVRAELLEILEGFRGLGALANEADVASILSDVERMRDDLDEALRFHERVLEIEREHGVRVEHSGQYFEVAAQDRSLWVDAGNTDSVDWADSLPEPKLDFQLVGESHAHLPELLEQNPFIVFSPPCRGIFGPVFPRGATAIASYLNAHGVPAIVVPLHLSGVDELSTLQRARRVIHDAVQSLRPRGVGISVTFTHLYPAGLEIAQFVGEADPEIPVVIGGPHVSYWDRECLEEAPAIDVVVRGEGEWTALELVRTLERGGDLSGVPGITWRDADGVIQRNKRRPLGDVLELPPTDFDLLPRGFAREMEVFGIASRGCTFRCRYCHEFRYWGGVVREHPAQRLVDELERLALHHQNPMRGIDDSMLNMKDPYFIELCDALGASPHLPKRFGLLTRTDTTTEEGLAAMVRAGIPSLSVGMESGSPKVLEAMNKGVTVEQAIAGLTLARDAGIHTSTFFIVGHPGENSTEAARTHDFIDMLLRERLSTWIDLSMFTPYPGTPFFISRKHGVRILTMDWRRWRRNSRPIAELDDFSAAEIYHAYLTTLQIRAHYRPDLKGVAI